MIRVQSATDRDMKYNPLNKINHNNYYLMSPVPMEMTTNKTSELGNDKSV